MALWIITGIAVAIALIGIVVVARGSGRAAGDDLNRVGSTRDERGRVVKLIDPLPLHTLGRDDVIDRDALDAIVHQLEPDAPGRRMGLYIALGTGVVIVVGITAMVIIEGAPMIRDLISTVTNPAIIACVAGGAIVPWFAARKQRLGRVRAVMLRHRHCPHCGYGLTGVPAGADGITTCPECECAWRIDAAACTDPGPVAAPRPRSLPIAIAIGTALFVAGIIAFLMMLQRNAAP